MTGCRDNGVRIFDTATMQLLLDILVEKRGELQSLKAEIENLKPLPEGEENAKKFILAIKNMIKASRTAA